MDSQISAKLDYLLGRTVSMESTIQSLIKTIDDKLDFSKSKEFLTDQDLEDRYGWTKSVRNKLVSQSKIKRYKPSGKAGASLYSREEIYKAIREQVVFPKQHIK